MTSRPLLVLTGFAGIALLTQALCWPIAPVWTGVAAGLAVLLLTGAGERLAPAGVPAAFVARVLGLLARLVLAVVLVLVLGRDLASAEQRLLTLALALVLAAGVLADAFILALTARGHHPAPREEAIGV